RARQSLTSATWGPRYRAAVAVRNGHGRLAWWEAGISASTPSESRRQGPSREATRNRRAVCSAPASAAREARATIRSPRPVVDIARSPGGGGAQRGRGREGGGGGPGGGVALGGGGGWSGGRARGPRRAGGLAQPSTPPIQVRRRRRATRHAQNAPVRPRYAAQ